MDVEVAMSLEAVVVAEILEVVGEVEEVVAISGVAEVGVATLEAVEEVVAISGVAEVGVANLGAVEAVFNRDIRSLGTGT